MGLIQELLNDILDSNTSLSGVLRRAKVLAYSLGNEQFKEWVDNELEGYKGDKQEIPGYRRSPADNFGHFLGPFNSQLRDVPIPLSNLPEPLREWASELLLVEGVRALESLLESDSARLGITWPADAILTAEDKIVRGYTCFIAWKRINRGQVEQVLDTVRNRLLDFVLELQKRYPEIGESEDAISNVPKDQVASVVNTYIYGNHNIVASGSNIAQEVQQQVRTNDLGALLNFMKSNGVPADDAEDLREAIEEDGLRKEPNKFGPKVADWAGKMTKKILEGTWNTAIATGPLLITKALSRYYGWE